MKKEDINFKIVKGVTLIANLSLGLWSGMIITGIVFLYRTIAFGQDIAIFSVFLGFCFLSLVGSILNIWAGNKLKPLKLKGTAKQLNQLCIKYSKWFFLPLMFALTINRVRGAMWDYIISHRTSDIDDPIEKVVEEYKIIDDLKTDGFISQYKYNDLKEKKQERMAEAKKIKAIQKKEKIKTKENDGEDEWIH